MSTGGVTLTYEQLQEILKSGRQETIEALKIAMAPSPEDQAKKDEVVARAAASRKASAETMMADYRGKQARHDACDHKKENGKWATGGQMLGTGIALTVCQHCQNEWYWKPSADVVQQLLSGDLTLHQSAPPSQSQWVNKPGSPAN